MNFDHEASLERSRRVSHSQQQEEEEDEVSLVSVLNERCTSEKVSCREGGHVFVASDA